MISNLIALVVVSFLWLYDFPALSAEPDAQQQQLMAGAKKEGQMVFYTSVETEFARALTSGFGLRPIDWREKLRI